jgi:AcrR family transcriptional regulator
MTRAPLSRDRVLSAALALADEGGTDALTMRRLGQELGVEAMSLYRHVANKEAVLAGITDLVMASIPLPEPGHDWKAAMRVRGVALHEALMSHPWAPPLLMSGMNAGPGMIRFIDWTLGVLRSAGFTWELADHAWNTMDSFIYGFTLRKLTFPIAAPDYASTAAAHLHLLAGFPHMQEMTRHVAAGEHPGEPEVTFGLELILEGLERAISRGVREVGGPSA